MNSGDSRLATRISLSTGGEPIDRNLTLKIIQARGPGDDTQVDAICKILPFHDVEVLTVEGVMPRVAQLTAIAMQMPRLRVVRVYNTPMIIHALKGALSIDDSATHIAPCDVGVLELDSISFLSSWQPTKIPKKSKQRAVGKIVYKNCTNVNPHIVALVRGLAGTDEDNYVGEEEVPVLEN